MKFNIKISILALMISVVGTQESYGQQDPHFTQYMYNTTSINPGYTGSTGGLSLTSLARIQWVNVDGAPETQTFSAHAPIGYSGLALGLNFMNDKIGPASELFLDGNVSYTIRLDDGKNLAMGLRLGGTMLNVDWSNGIRRDQTDEAFTDNINNDFLPSIGAGVYYYTDKSYVGLSVPNFIQNKHFDNQRFNVAQEELHFFLMGGYVFDINPTIKFKPAFLTKVVQGAPLSLDVSANFLFHDRFTAGIAYRLEDSISGLVGFQITNKLFLGYAYDLTTSSYQVFNNGTHELMLRFNFLDGVRVKSPRFF